MSQNINESAFRRLMDQAFSEGRLDVVDELVAPSFAEHQPRGPGMPTVGPGAVKAVIESLRSSFPDITYTVEDLVVDGDRVWARMTARATNDGPFLGHPPTGRSMAIDVIDITRFENGKMVEHWGVPDRLGAVQQLGLLPAPRPVPGPEGR